MATNTWIYIVVIYLIYGTFVSGQETPTSIYFLHIKSDIKYRFATTLITSKVVNPDETSREVIFDVTLPNEAFMTNFTLEIDGNIHVGEVKEKEEAKQQYEQAKKQNQTAGHISAKARETNKFNIAVNVEAMGKVTFNLTYQERLLRKVGKYKHVIYVDPGQAVDDFQIEVAIQESRDITSLDVPPIRNDLLTNVNVEISDSNNLAIIQRPTPKSAYILYSPSVDEQRFTSKSGISGQFIVEYDVDRQKDAGDLLVVNGYFVHYFAPAGIEVLPKNVLFILDKSGSMSGKKIIQLKKAMLNILDDIRDTDYFNIMTFNGDINYWKDGEEVVQATEENINDAKKFIRRLSSSGMTNINTAMTEGIKLLASRPDNSRANVLIFLTDGRPTVGETNTNTILQNVLKFNEVTMPIFSLAFGQGADYGFVRKVAARNNGLGRKIYEDSDAALQIKGFYDEISTVLLKNVTFTYLNGIVNDSTLTQTTFNTYFEGSEIVVAGKITDTNLQTIAVSVSGNSLGGMIQLNLAYEIVPDVMTLNLTQNKDFESITEKLWAYLTIKQLLKEKEGSSDAPEQERLKQEILGLSLKYKFVTPMTSMVVTLPNTTDVKPLEDFLDKENRPVALPSIQRQHHKRWNRQHSIKTPLSAGFVSHGIGNRQHGFIQPLSPGFHYTAGNRRRKPLRKVPNTMLTDRNNRRKRKKMKNRRVRKTPAVSPTFIIKINGVMEPLCVNLGLKPGRTYKLLQHSDSGTLVYARTASIRLSRRQKRSKRRKIKVKHARHKRLSCIVSDVVMETGGQSLVFTASKYSIDGQETIWDTDTFALNVFNQNIKFSVDVIPTNGSSLHGDEHLQIYSDISSSTQRLDGLLANFADISGTVTNRKSRRGKTMAKLNLRKGNKVFKLRRVLRLINPSNVIGSCWSIKLKKNMARVLGVSPGLYENGSVL